MNMMHNWGRPSARLGQSPFNRAQPPHPLVRQFEERWRACAKNINRPPYAEEKILPFAEAAWFFENPVSAIRVNLAAPEQQRFQFFAGPCILMRPSLEGLELPKDGKDPLERTTLVFPVEPVWKNLMRIARWMVAEKVSL